MAFRDNSDLWFPPMSPIWTLGDEVSSPPTTITEELIESHLQYFNDDMFTENPSDGHSYAKNLVLEHKEEEDEEIDKERYLRLEQEVIDLCGGGDE